MWPVGMPRDLHLLPGRQLSITLLQQPVGLRFEPTDLLGDVEAAIGREMAKLIDLAFELGDRPFEIEEMAHRACGLLALRQRMRGLDQPPQPLALHMRVYLRRRDIGMSEHLLHAPQIGSVIEQQACLLKIIHRPHQSGCACIIAEVWISALFKQQPHGIRVTV